MIGNDKVLREIEQLQYAYARCLDDDHLERWPGMFAPDRCRYEVIPRENLQIDPPLAILMCDSPGMLHDRVRSLRQANVYNLHYPRRQITNVEIVGESADGFSVRANYVLFQTTLEGRTELYSVGHYRDRVVSIDGDWRFREKRVIVDTFSIPHLLAVPL
ncbi:MAG: aromatic-ring-hydroxylating dioxygenase subunit beta [Burkholderiaceae bacterium]